MSEQGPTVFNGRYELHRQLARGGMADVFLARDQLLDRPVAIKVLFAEFATDPSFVERFRREAQAAANLNHPNIVSIFDWGEERGTYFIVMEYVEGRSLADILKTEGPLHPDRAADIAIDVAAALGFAHRNGLVHRDVKPGNVLIDPQGQVKVADFGIATAIAGAQSELTQPGSVMGTATYLSPEQAQGQPVDPRSDLYSLGVVLYEMLVGKPPFVGDSPVAVAYQHVQETPVPPAQSGAPIAESLNLITLKVLAKAPANRYPSAEDLRADLRRYREGAHSVRSAAAPTGPAQRPQPAAPAPQQPVAPAQVPVPVDATVAIPAAAPAPQPAAQPQQFEPAHDIYDDGRDRAKRMFLFGVTLILLLAATGFLLVQLAKSLGLNGGDETDETAEVIEIPSVIGDAYEDAQQRLTDEGFAVKLEFEANEDEDENVVFDQSPLAGVKVQPGTEVLLTVSEGEGPRLVPNLIDIDIDTAAQTLTDLGFVVVPIPQEDDEVAENLVIDQQPPPDTELLPGEQVTLTFSSGGGIKEVPSVVGRTPSEAAVFLSDLCFDWEEMEEPSDTVEEGKVIRTEPPAGTPYECGAIVQIFVSTGIEMKAVSSVLEMRFDSAVTALEQESLQVFTQFEDVPLGDPRANRVIAQNPVAGTEVEVGSTVTIVVGREVAPATTTVAPTTTLAP